MARLGHGPPRRVRQPPYDSASFCRQLPWVEVIQTTYEAALHLFGPIGEQLPKIRPACRAASLLRKAQAGYGVWLGEQAHIQIPSTYGHIQKCLRPAQRRMLPSTRHYLPIASRMLVLPWPHQISVVLVLLRRMALRPLLVPARRSRLRTATILAAAQSSVTVDDGPWPTRAKVKRTC